MSTLEINKHASHSDILQFTVTSNTFLNKCMSSCAFYIISYWPKQHYDKIDKFTFSATGEQTAALSSHRRPDSTET